MQSFQGLDTTKIIGLFRLCAVICLSSYRHYNLSKEHVTFHLPEYIRLTIHLPEYVCLTFHLPEYIR